MQYNCVFIKSVGISNCCVEIECKCAYSASSSTLAKSAKDICKQPAPYSFHHSQGRSKIAVDYEMTSCFRACHILQCTRLHFASPRVIKFKCNLSLDHDHRQTFAIHYGMKTILFQLLCMLFHLPRSLICCSLSIAILCAA